MKNVLKFLFCVFILVFISSCTSKIGTFTVISTRNIEWSRANEYKRGNKVDGKDISHFIFFIPTKYHITIDDAVEQALDKVPGAVALVDVSIKVRDINACLYMQFAYIVEGSVLIDPLLVSQEELETSSYYVGMIDKKDNVTIAKVSKAEYEKMSIKK